MATAPFVIKSGNLLPSVRATLTDDAGVVDLDGIDGVEFILRKAPEDGNVEEAELVFRADATVLVAAQGTVAYDWTSGQTDDAGRYIAEFVVTKGGKPWSFPTDGYIPVIIKPSLL